MGSLYTITALAAIRCKSVAGLDRSWTTVTHESILTNSYVWAIWGMSLIIALPPMVGFGKYALDIGAIRYLNSSC
jgi:hypothetical protein